MTNYTTQMRCMIDGFMRAFDQGIYPSAEGTPCEVALLRSSLIKEESHEYHQADNHSVDELDAIIDLLYVVIGTNIALNTDVLPYSSGQLYVSNLPKQAIFTQVNAMVSDLDSRFPCSKFQFKTSNALIFRLLDIATMHGYKLFPAFEAVHIANMGKLWDTKPTDPTLIVKPVGGKWLVKRPDGKVLKPSSFCTPHLEAFVPS